MKAGKYEINAVEVEQEQQCYTRSSRHIL